MNLLLADVPLLSKQLKFGALVILMAFMVNMTVPQTVQAENIILASAEKEAVLMATGTMDMLTERFVDYDLGLRKAPEVDVVRTVTVVATAYSSTVDQCDSTPCITASGMNVCDRDTEDVIAANFLKFGTKVRIPELYGDKVFTVQDRMNPKYDHRIDLWKTSRNRAITFGKRLVKIEVIK
jgi:3D (Asp-Asp-Asp) domain-containing protein